MKDKTPNVFLKSSSPSYLLTKESSFQKQVSSKYLKYKKAASQPAYFLSKSRLKKVADIYRAASLEKLVRHPSLENSKSLHRSITPQKNNPYFTQSLQNNFKNSQHLKNLNLNKALDSNEKTKRLCINKNRQERRSKALQDQNIQFIHILVNMIEKLEYLSTLNLDAAFSHQYEDFFRLFEQKDTRKTKGKIELGRKMQRIINLFKACQDRQLKIRQKQVDRHCQKLQTQLSNMVVQLQKKNLKNELLRKEANNLLVQNVKLAQQLTALKKNQLISFQPPKNSKVRSPLQISQQLHIKVLGVPNDENSQGISHTPVLHQHQNMNAVSTIDYPTEYIYIQQEKNQNQNLQKKQINPVPLNQKLELIKKIRNLEKKQRQLTCTLLVLRSDGVDVQKAFQQVLRGEHSSIDVTSPLKFEPEKLPRYVREIRNNDSYEADSSIIDSVDGLTVRYFEGEPPEDYVFYPIKNEYKSKPLPENLQEKLKLDFRILYEGCQSDSYQVNSDPLLNAQSF